MAGLLPLRSKPAAPCRTPLWKALRRTDTAPMTLWTFGKEKERIGLGRPSDSCALVVERLGMPVSEYRFEDEARLQAFQADMEAFQLRTGWTLLNYSPDRRRYRDRRGFPRLTERRRWWTDANERAKVVWGGKSQSA